MKELYRSIGRSLRRVKKRTRRRKKTKPKKRRKKKRTKKYKGKAASKFSIYDWCMTLREKMKNPILCVDLDHTICLWNALKMIGINKSGIIDVLAVDKEGRKISPGELAHIIKDKLHTHKKLGKYSFIVEKNKELFRLIEEFGGNVYLVTNDDSSSELLDELMRKLFSRQIIVLSNDSIVEYFVRSDIPFSLSNYGKSFHIGLAKYFEEKGFLICVVGTKMDYSSVEPILKICNNVVNKINQSPPEVVYTIAKKSHLIISNDTGPGHIAALSNTNILWLGLNNPVSKSNLSQGKNSFSILSKNMNQITVSKIIQYINQNKLFD